MVFISDGSASSIPLAHIGASVNLYFQARIIAISLGYDINRNELLALSSAPHHMNTFLDHGEDLSSILTQVAQAICPGEE